MYIKLKIITIQLKFRGIKNTFMTKQDIYQNNERK